MKYKDSNAFEKAFDEEINQRAGSDSLQMEVRNDVALERLAARFDPDTVAIKGGFAIRTLVQSSPYTQDLDILIKNEDWREFAKDDLYEEVSAL